MSKIFQITSPTKICKIFISIIHKITRQISKIISNPKTHNSLSTRTKTFLTNKKRKKLKNKKKILQKRHVFIGKIRGTNFSNSRNTKMRSLATQKQL
jgi:hypothetical protein